MDDSSPNHADDTAISFDLQDSFDENKGKIDVFNEQEVPDSELGALLDQVSSTYPTILQKSDAANSVKTKMVEISLVQAKHFPVLTEEEVDEIASNTIKNKTREQTVWV